MKLGFIGRQGSGKDYVLENLILPKYEQVNIVRMASPLKEIASVAFADGDFEKFKLLESNRETNWKEKRQAITETTLNKVIDKCISVFKEYKQYYPNLNIYDKNIDIFYLDEEHTIRNAISFVMFKFRQRASELVYIISPRKLQQIIGTEIFRKRIDNNFWINLSLIKDKEWEKGKSNPISVCPDIRFIEEYLQFPDLVLYIHNSNKDNLAEPLSQAEIQAMHSSEHLCEEVRNLFVYKVKSMPNVDFNQSGIMENVYIDYQGKRIYMYCNTYGSVGDLTQFINNG